MKANFGNILKMKKAIIIFFITFLALSLKAQSLQGFYTGQLKLSAAGLRLNVQLDLMQDSGEYSAVLRFRAVEDNQLSGCDNWMAGIGNIPKLRFQNMVSLRETNIASWICNDFKWLDLELKKGSTGMNPEFTGTLTNKNGSQFGKLTLTKVDSVNSFSVEEERAEALYRLSERQIAMTKDDSTRVAMMLVNRGIQMLDSLEISSGNTSLLVEAPTADRFHKLTLLINDNIVLLNTAPAQKAALIKLDDPEEGELEIVLLCYHTMVDVNYFVKLTLKHPDGEKVWEIPVSTFKNRGIKLKVIKKT